MELEQNNQKDKLYYTVSEVSEMFSITATTLRYWEKEISQIKPERTSKGNRRYTPKDVELLKLIYHLTKEKKMKIEGVKQYLKTKNYQSIEKEMLIVDKLKKIKEALSAMYNEI